MPLITSFGKDHHRFELSKLHSFPAGKRRKKAGS